MPEGEVEDSQKQGGEGPLPAPVTLRDAVQHEISEAIEKGAIEKINIVQGKSRVPGEVPHARERIVMAGIAMAVSLVAAASPWTPDNARSGLLSIASVVATSLVKPFEKN